jgi:hypothetical protein
MYVDTPAHYCTLCYSAFVLLATLPADLLDVIAAGATSPGDKGSPRHGACAIVPHLACHLAELCGIDGKMQLRDLTDKRYHLVCLIYLLWIEGNSTFLNESPHLINMNKKRLVFRSAVLIFQLQKFRYLLTPVRILCSNLSANFRSGQCFSQADSIAGNKELFNISLAREPQTNTATPMLNNNRSKAPLVIDTGMSSGIIL